MRGADIVFHLAANADVRFGTEHPRKDLEQNTIATFNVLEAMRANGVRRDRVFVDGVGLRRGDCFPTPEDAPFPVQTSLYGASKLAGEGLIAGVLQRASASKAAFSGSCRFSASATRTATSSISARSLRRDPTTPAGARQRPAAQVVPLRQRLHRRDRCWRCGDDEAASHIFNLGTDEYCEVNDSIGWITRAPRASADARVHRRRPRLDRRQSVHFSRYARGSARSAGRPGSRSARASFGPSTTCRQNPSSVRGPRSERCGPGTLAPGLGHRRVHWPRRHTVTGLGSGRDDCRRRLTAWTAAGRRAWA